MTPPWTPLAIGGPTGTGKTVLAVEVAHRLGGELLNADSRQVAARLRVGTAAPTRAELRGITCHLLDLCEPGDPFTVADWVRRTRACLDDLDTRGVPAIIVGGTGQYLRALREGWELGGGPPDPRLRAKLAAIAASAEGMAGLVVELRARDPEGAAALDLGNPRRVIRAVELLRGGAPSLARARRRTGGRRLDLVVLDAECGLHREALTHRLDTMFVGGALLAEVAAELSRGTAPAALRRAGIGYAEALDMIDGRLDVEAASAVAMQRTRRYVKAQRTWFRQEDAALRLERGPGSTASGMAEAVLAMIAAGRDHPASTASLRKFSRKP